MTKQRQVRIVFTGGHHTPALAVIAALEKKIKPSAGRTELKIYWVGHKYSVWGDENYSVEYREVAARGIPFFDLKAGKVYRTFHPLKLIRLPLGFLQAGLLLLRIRPHLIMTFGGYLSVPVALAGWLGRVPILLHEQTLVPGLASRLVALLARKIMVSWPETEEYFPSHKVVLTGNPLRSCLFKAEHPPFFSGERQNWPILYITGGKQGAHYLNEVAGAALPELLRFFNVIHQCGNVSFHEDRKHLEAVRSKLPEERRLGYLLQSYFNEGEIGAVYHQASLIISRAGANTVYELAALGKPALLIPLPWSSGREQEKNAQKLVETGLAEIMLQEELNPASLVHKVKNMYRNIDKYREAANRARSLVVFAAAQNIAAEVGKELMLE